MIKKYLPKEFEKKWIEMWEKEGVYKTPAFAKAMAGKGKKYVLDMFPYPSGAGLHVGHPRGYTATDILARYLRMKDFTVLHPMGWDAFGLPAENAALKAKKNPMDMVPKNIDNFRRQMKMLGFSYDWDREFSTTDPAYYRWTQWLFIQFFKMGLLYKKLTPVYFCEFCKTGLAEEEVLPDGTHERCGRGITRKNLPQWIFRITQYADKLLAGLQGLDWPAGILEMQKNWIGRKEGINIKYQVSGIKYEITCFTTRPDTNFGATFIVLAPEHEFVQKLISGDIKGPDEEMLRDINDYVCQSLAKTDLERIAEGRKKTGIFTGFYAINNLTGRKMPIWISDFVLPTVGTGAVVGVPGHDSRDYQFTKEFGLPVEVVVLPDKNSKFKIQNSKLQFKIKNDWIEGAYEGEGVVVNSDFLNGLTTQEAIKTIINYLEEKGWGKRTVSYHLRDWIFSRQRYWGEPIPMIHCKKCDWVPVPDNELPLKLPYVKSYEPTETGESPLANIKDWVNTTCPYCGGPARRETDTMPNWAGSCWYYLYFASKEIQNSKFKIQNYPSIENWKLKIGNYLREWLPVDWYVGGAEHAVLHLLYARFWVKAMKDLGLVDFSEPFKRLRNVGIILAADHRKMSKSLGNVINPDDVVAEYGADTLRVYEMFMAPFSQEIAWSTKMLQGAYRFLRRVWDIYHRQYQISNIKYQSFDRLRIDPEQGRMGQKYKSNIKNNKLITLLNKTIKKVTDDIVDFKFNTAIAAMMKFLNEWEKNVQHSALNVKQAKSFLQILAPFAPFMTEEIWREVLGEKTSIHLSSWPKVEEKALIEEEVTIPVQVNGKLRAVITVSAKDLSKDTVVKKALENEKVKKYLQGKKYQEVYVKGKILNFVTANR